MVSKVVLLLLFLITLTGWFFTASQYRKMMGMAYWNGYVDANNECSDKFIEYNKFLFGSYIEQFKGEAVPSSKE